MQKNTFVLILVASIALASGIVAQSYFTKSNPISDLSLPDVTGQLQPLKQWQDKIQVINFWATWCPSCLAEMSDFIELQQQFKHQNVQFIGIAVDNSTAVKQYLAHLEINYPILIAGDSGLNLTKQLGNSIGAIPFTLVINLEREVVHHQLGEMSKKQLINVIEPLLREKLANKL